MLPAYERATDTFGAGTTHRELILHDSLIFLALGAATLVLYGVTFFLFQSFQRHRQQLAVSWADRGRSELQHRDPRQAIESLRASLSYLPDDYSTQLLLAQALADSGETTQATNYFLNLWAARPGDGLLNLQLARLTRHTSRKTTVNETIDYYRAAIFGDWNGDAIERRRDARLELIDYLIQQHRLPAARAELLIAAGNAPDAPAFNILVADKLLAAADPQDALNLYNKALADDPRDLVALEHAARLHYLRGDYAAARELLNRALADGAAPDPQLITLDHNSQRLLELSLSRDLPAHERTRHILDAAKIAEARLALCTSDPGHAPPPELLAIQARWRAAGDDARLRALAQDAAGQDNLTQLIFDTERETEPTCGPATGDDALLLKLAEDTGDAR